MQNVEATFLSQYANSARLIALIGNLNDCVDPAADIDAFFQNVWNIDTAVGYGLDCWGRIVGLPNGRILKIPDDQIYIGFSEAGTESAAPLSQAPIYPGYRSTQNFSLSDDAFRTLILVKAMANILDGSIPSYNKLLQLLFAGRGRCYINDVGNMQMRYTFEFYLEPFELAIITSSGILPRPTGVLASSIQVPVPNIIGFREQGAGVAPLSQGTLYSSGTVYTS